MSYRRLQQWANLLSVLKYGLVFLVVLAYLPLTAFAAVPGSSLLGGLFVALDPSGVFWAAVAFFSASWSLAFTTGLLVESAETRWGPPVGGAPELRESRDRTPSPHLPEGAARRLGLPTSRGLFLLASVQPVVALAIVLGHAERPLLGAAAALAGGVAAYLVALLISMPARVLDGDAFLPPLLPPGRWLVRLFARPWLIRPAAWVRDRVSGLLYRLGIRYVLEPVTGPDGTRWQILPAHFFALSCVVGLAALVLAAAWLFFPPRPVLAIPSAAALLYVLLTLLIWTLLGMDTHLARLRISPLLLLVLWMATVWWLEEVDHDYRVELRPRAQEEELSPVEAAAASRAPGNLVVVASSGGGILAAGWTTLVLKELIVERPELAREIRLLSTISGSSVGAAHYASRLRGVEDPAALPPGELAGALAEVYRRSVASSLAESAYGLAMLDFWRLFFATSPLYPSWDRGRLQENAWGRIAGELALPLSSLRGPIREGRIPSLVMGATVLEKGQRLMLTPLTFSDRPAQVRAETLSEFVDAGQGEEADLDLWTAARLSASFPYVSPAARAALSDAGGGPLPARGGSALHLIDGGYFDNFGVTSALDWLEPVLAARLAGDSRLGFRRVVLVRLNAFSGTDLASPEPISGSLAALLGPLLGTVNLRTGVAVTRNAIDLDRFGDSWNARFAAAGLDVCLVQVELRPPAFGEEPLSWHMTPAQIRDQQEAWAYGFDPARAGEPGSLRHGWEAMKRVLEGGRCGGEEAPVLDLEEMLAEQKAAA